MIFHLLYLLFALQFRNLCYLPPISLERTLQVLFGEDRKSMSGDYSSVLVILILHRFDLALHASLVMIYLYSMFSLFFKKKKKIGGENAGNFIFSFLGISDITCIFS
jgi:hypothetical protein